MGLSGVREAFEEDARGDVRTVFRENAEVRRILREVSKEYDIPPEEIFNPAMVSQPALMSLVPSANSLGGTSEP